MSLIGEKVYHKKFGEGVIIMLDDAHITVNFISEGNKQFSYPSCFESYLKLEDNANADKVAEEITQQNNRKNEETKIITTKIEKHFSRLSETRKMNQWEDNENTNTYFSSNSVKTFSSVESFCSAYQTSLTNEIVYLKRTGGKRQRLVDGKKVETKGEQYVYSFESDSELNYPDGSKITIWRSPEGVPGTIIGCEEFTVLFSTEYNLGDDVLSIEISAEPWLLLNTLEERLSELANEYSDITEHIVCNDKNLINYSQSAIVKGQFRAVEMACNQAITFVWGPPGTGKTETLGKIATEHIKRDNSILMLSYSNVSVDGAVMRVNKLAKNLKPGTIVRYGYPRLKELIEHEYLTAYNLAIKNHPELMQERNDLLAERKGLTRLNPRYTDISRRLTEIKNSLKKEEQDVVAKAQFVATTVSKAVADKTIYARKFDVVIFDEASMAYIPQIVFAANLANKHFICMGDFRQLPPIVQSKEATLLNTDIFDYCGISKAVANKCSHEWLCMLNTQYRMHPQIAEFASNIMYGRLLESAEKISQSRNEIAALAPMPRNALALADLSGMMSVCTKTGDNSRINVLSAFISMSLALKAATRCEVGIITPYHAQSRLLHAMARDMAESNPDLKRITCATVHQFQGSEQDVIIYDAVDCYRMTHPGMLLSSQNNNYANRLFNVALTRAKGKFVAVSNIDYMENKNLPQGLMFRQLINKLENSSSCINGVELTKPDSNISNSGMSYIEKVDAAKILTADIKAARHDIRIDIPDRPFDSNELDRIVSSLNEAKRRGVKVAVRSECKKTLPELLKSIAIEFKFVTNPLVIIDKKIIWFGMPESNADFISESVRIKSTHHPVIRFVGSNTAKALYGFMEMNKTLDQDTAASVDEDGNIVADTFASYVYAKTRCKKCKKPMKLKKNAKGRFYLSCSAYPECKGMEYVTAEQVEEYFYREGPEGQLCSRCGRSLEAKMGQYGIYVQCCGIAQHKYKLDQI